MKPHRYNEAIQCLDVEPAELAKGLAHAESNGITDVRIIHLDYTDGPKMDLDLAPFDGKRFVEKLVIGDFAVREMLCVDALYTLPKLRHLETRHAFDVDFSRLAQLTTLYFKDNNEFQNLAALTNLTDVLAVGIKSEDCGFASAFKKLELLRLQGAMTSLAGIEALHAVGRLDVTHSPRLVDASAAASMRGLRRLHFERCKRLTDYGFLAGNDHIEDLFIDNLDSLEFLPAMTRLKKIFFWNCKSGDLTPLLESKSLEQIDFHPQKRRYSHTREELLAERNE